MASNGIGERSSFFHTRISVGSDAKRSSSNQDQLHLPIQKQSTDQPVFENLQHGDLTAYLHEISSTACCP